MGEKISFINKEHIEALIQKLADPENFDTVIEEVRRMINSKQEEARLADRNTCCTASGANVDINLYAGLNLLNGTLRALVEKDMAKATELLKHYSEMLI